MAGNLSASIGWRLADVLKGSDTEKQSQTGTATFVRTDPDGTAWIRLPGNDFDTPVEGGVYVDAKSGDTVTYTISGGQVSVSGNATSPSVGGTYVSGVVAPVEQQASAAYAEAVRAHEAADAAEVDAERAHVAADAAQADATAAGIAAASAQESAEQALDDASAASVAATAAQASATQAIADAATAQRAADAAQGSANQAQASAVAAMASATTANQAANGALAGLGTLESVIDTVEWFAAHKTASTDITVQSDKNYYEYDSSTGTLSKVTPEGTENPSQEGWYELDETIQNYVGSHIAMTDDGLYVVGLSGGWRVLVSTGAGDYVAGVFLVDPQGVIAQATTGSGITFNENKPFYIGDEDAFIVFDGNGGIQIGGAVTLGQYGTLSQMLAALNASISAVEYGVGSSPTSHSDIVSWSSSTPTWQAGKYVWMRTTTNGQTYTYTCIQGADGPQGATGAAGADGTSVTVSKIEYGTSNSASTQPSSWSQSVPTSIAQGKWLWVKTTYSDNSTATTKSYVGTDGDDGTSVYVQSATKTGDTTTVIIADTDGNTTTLTIVDGEDGDDGQPGAGGYVHVAWANSADGTVDFSTTVSANKSYLGIYTDQTQADSTDPGDYSWSLIKGAKGDTGDTGPAGATGATGPEAIVAITVDSVSWANNSATIRATLRVDGTVKTSGVTYKWTKDTSSTSIGTQRTLAITDLNASYHCTCTW